MFKARMTKNDQEMAVTVWRDGTWQVWGILDAYYVQSDPEWLVTILLKDLPSQRDTSGVATERREATVPCL